MRAGYCCYVRADQILVLSHLQVGQNRAERHPFRESSDVVPVTHAQFLVERSVAVGQLPRFNAEQCCEHRTCLCPGRRVLGGAQFALGMGTLAGQRETVHLPLAELAHEGLNLLVRRARPVVAAMRAHPMAVSHGVVMKGSDALQCSDRVRRVVLCHATMMPDPAQPGRTAWCSSI